MKYEQHHGCLSPPVMWLCQPSLPARDPSSPSTTARQGESLRLVQPQSLRISSVHSEYAGDRSRTALSMPRTMALSITAVLVSGVQVSLSSSTGVWVPQPCSCDWGYPCQPRLSAGEQLGEHLGLMGSQNTNWLQALGS